MCVVLAQITPVGVEVRVLQGDQVVVTIGNPIAAEGSKSSGHGMAMANISERLQLAFGSRASLLTSQDAEHFYTVLSLPYVEYSDH